MSYFDDHFKIKEKVFREPVHGYIYIQNQIILDLINTKEFQRLRRVKQLGTTYLVFHGAEHTRFGHCLGVYEVVRQICNQFSRNYPSTSSNDGLWNDDKERPVALCAALLHDIGHGAFSHTFEKLFDTDHEAITVRIITEEGTEVNDVLRQVSPTFPSEVASVISHEYENPQVVQMISSQCDADRMDYLLRDSYYTGAEYGKFDIQRILRVMQPYQDGIRFRYEGMHAIEDYIVSRYQMYMQVYFHPVSRAMEVILKKLIERAKAVYQYNPSFFSHYSPYLVPFFNNTWNLEDYLKLDDGVMTTYFQTWIDYSDDPILVDLADRFVNRKPFKSVTFDPETQMDTVRELAEKIEALGYDTDYYIAINTSHDLPYDLYRPNAKKPRTQIELIERDGNMVELSEASRLVASLTGQEVRDDRIYFPNELYYGKNKEHVNLFQPILDDIHQMTKTGKLKSL